LDLSHPSKYMFYAVFLMRRIIFVFMLVLFTQSPVISIGVHCGASMFMIMFVLVAKPFTTKLPAALTILGELFVMAFHLVGLGIDDPDQPDDQNQQFGFLIVLMISVFIVVSFLSVIIQAGIDIIAECRRRK
jgi:hypothetical protein